MPTASQAKKSTEHVCKFKRHTYETGTKVYFCTLPKCSKKLKVGLALGKECICWRCGNPFIMNEYSVRLAKPHCMDCHKSKSDSPSIGHVDNLPINTHLEQDNNQNPIVVQNQPITPLAERLKKATQIEDEDI